MSLFRFIDAERAYLPVALLCRILGVSRSGYHAWRSRPPSMKSRQDAVLTEKIREIHRRSRETYGSPRVHAELRVLGIGCSRKRVERLMRRAGIRGCMRGKRRGTTRRGTTPVGVEDLVKREFTATAVDEVRVADITYIPTQEGFLYLALVLDVHSRRIVGWAMEGHLRTEVVVDALGMGSSGGISAVSDDEDDAQDPKAPRDHGVGTPSSVAFRLGTRQPPFGLV